MTILCFAEPLSISKRRNRATDGRNNQADHERDDRRCSIHWSIRLRRNFQGLLLPAQEANTRAESAHHGTSSQSNRSCNRKWHGIDPFRYLAYVLRLIISSGDRMFELLPDI